MTNEKAPRSPVPRLSPKPMVAEKLAPAKVPPPDVLRHPNLAQLPIKRPPPPPSPDLQPPPIVSVPAPSPPSGEPPPYLPLSVPPPTPPPPAPQIAVPLPVEQSKNVSPAPSSNGTSNISKNGAQPEPVVAITREPKPFMGQSAGPPSPAIVLKHPHPPAKVDTRALQAAVEVEHFTIAIRSSYAMLLGRRPSQSEIDHWTITLSSAKPSFAEIFKTLHREIHLPLVLKRGRK